MPTKNSVHTNQALTNISIAHTQSALNFVADRVFPKVPVKKQSDLYWTYNQADMMRDTMDIRADGNESAGDDYGVLTAAPYFCNVRSLHKDIGDQERANTDSPLDADTDATVFLTQKALINKERNFANSFMVTGVWGTDVTPGTLWDAAGSTPITDIRTAVTTIQRTTGQKANKIVAGFDVVATLMDHATLIDRVKYTSTSVIADVNIPELAALFGVDEFLVMAGVYNTAAEGATNAPVFIGAKDMLVLFAAPTPSLRVPSAGYTFVWTDYSTSDGMSIDKMRQDVLKSDRIEIEYVWDQKVIAPAAGYFLNNVIS